jgi:hypothetical protein
MPVPYTFGTATAAIPLSQLDSNFATAVTIGNTAVQLGNTVTTLNNLTLANVTISSGSVTITNVAVTTANVSGTANISTLVVIGNESVGGNTTVTGNVSTTNLTLTGGTANGVGYLNGSKVLTTGSALSFDGTNLQNLQTSASPVGLILRNESSSTSAGARLTFNYQGSTTGYVGNQFDGGDFNNQYMAAQSHIWFTTTTERMRLTATGLGIGTSSPSFGGFGSNTGGIQITNATNAALKLNGNAGGDFYFVSGSSQHWLYATGAVPMSFATNGSERMRIDSSGRLLLGSSTANANLGATGFQITSAETCAVILCTNASGQAMRFFSSTTTQAGFITVNGATTTYNSASDYRLKENVTQLVDGLSVISKLKPVKYTWKVDGNAGEGFIAHELQESIPLAVQGVKDQVDDNGDIDPQGIDQSKIVPYLVSAIQEQQALIQSLTTRLNALENK